MISCTIGGIAVQVANASFSLEDPLENRSILTFTVLDSSGTATYTRGEPVTFSDPGILSYTGYVQSDQPTKDGLASSFVEHMITCMDGVYNLGKRSNTQNYLNWKAGNIAVDFVRRDLTNEGITVAAAMHRDTTVSDFSQGNLNGMQGAINGTDDGDLELALAGSVVTITENTTANFGTGALTNVVATGNTLSPTTESAIMMKTQLPITVTGVAGTTYIYMEIWSGSQVVGTLDTLNYDIWIDANSPAFNAGVDLNFSDGTTLHSYTGPVDQNAYPASTLTNLTTFAKGAWYTRNISLTSALNGKTVNSVTIGVTGVNAGTYTLYVRNCYLSSHSGTPFFSTTATTTNVNPATVYSSAGYVPVLSLVSVVQTSTGLVSNRVSPAYSISTGQIVKSSIITWNAQTPGGSNMQVAVSYDGNAFLPCTNNQPLPNLPAGSNISGISLYFMEIFTPGTNPTLLPTLYAVNVQINPAPAATKSDIVTNYGTSAQWNAGTLSYLAPNSNGDLTLGSILRDWNDNLITNQSFFQSIYATGATQSVVSGAYQLYVPGYGSSGGIDNFALSRLDFANIQTDFIAEWDQKITTSGSGVGDLGFIYRTVGWSSGLDGNYGYLLDASVTNSTLGIYYGANTNTSGGTGGTVQSVSQAFSAGVTYHFKLVVTGNNHQVYLNHATTPTINANDNTYTVGYIGFYAGGTNASAGNDTMTFDNLVVTPATSGTWLSPSASLSALTTIGGSTISWLETLANGTPSATAVVQSSIDGGATFQNCTQNTAIPGLIPGVNVSSKSLIIKITLYANSIATEPVIGGLNWRVLGAFPTVTGTRDTSPMGNDTQITRTVGSGWGTAFDGQAWTQVGTGTTQVSSNEETIANTSGDVHMVLGSRTYTDEEGTMRFALSAATISVGMELRYTNANNYYRLAASTTALSIIKNTGGGNTTLATATVALSTGTFYWMRFRVVGSGPALLYGKVWADSTLEPGVSLGVMSAANPQWTVTASD